jgi:hypothetical protein
MNDLSTLARRWLEKAENMAHTDEKPIDPLEGTPTIQKRLTGDSGKKKAPISKRRSPMVNKAHIEALFVAFQLEYDSRWVKRYERTSQAELEAYWLKRLQEAQIDEMAINAAMGRIGGHWPPSVDEFVALCRPHTYEAKIGTVERYAGERPEPGPGYEQFREYKERHGRRGKPIEG